MTRKIKWYRSLRVRVSLVILLLVLLLEATGGFSLYYFDRLNNAVQQQATENLPALEVLNSTQLGISKLANLSGAMSRSESPAHSRILMSQVRAQIAEIQKGLDQVVTDEQVAALKRVVASVEPSMERISFSKARLDQAEVQLREKLAQAIRLTTGSIVGAQGRTNDVAGLNVLLINLSQLLTIDTLYEQNHTVANIRNALKPFTEADQPRYVYLTTILLGDNGVIDALEQRERYRSEVVAMDTQNRILLGNLVDFGQRVYADIEESVTDQANITSEQSTLFSKMLGGVLLVQLVIAVFLVVFLHRQLFTRLQSLHNIVSDHRSITDQDVLSFDPRNEVGLLVKQLKDYVYTIQQQQQQIATTSQQLQTMIRHAQMRTVVIDKERVLYCSEPLRQMFPDSRLKKLADFPEGLSQQLRIAEAAGQQQLEENYFDDVQQRWYDITCDSIYWNGDQATLISFIDVTERVQAAQEYERTLFEVESEAHIDPLTRLFNRKMFDRQVGLYDGVSEQDSMAVLLFDVDHFKGYNDQLGHLQGDKVLQMVASVIQRNTPANGLAIRYGGEEFLVLLPTSDQKLAVNVAQTIVEDVFAQQVPHPTSPYNFLSVSCGVSVRTQAMESLLHIFDQADKSLYKAKNSGRNCVLLHRQAA